MVSSASVIQVIDLVAQVFQWIILAYVIISWVPPLRQSAVGGILSVLTEPVLMPIRWLLDRSPLARSPLDLSVLFAYLFIGVVATLLKGFALWLM